MGIEDGVKVSDKKVLKEEFVYNEDEIIKTIENNLHPLHLRAGLINLFAEKSEAENKKEMVEDFVEKIKDYIQKKEDSRIAEDIVNGHRVTLGKLVISLKSQGFEVSSELGGFVKTTRSEYTDVF